MRFPDYQNTKFVKGVPQEWPFELGSLFFDHVKGKSYSSHEISDHDGECYFITLKSFYRRGGYRKEGLKYFSGSYKKQQCVEDGDVVMAVTDMTQDRAVVGEVARIPVLHGKKTVISLDVIKLVPIGMSKTFLYAYMRHSGFANYIKEFANGANVLHLKPDLVGKQRLLFPPENLRDQFSKIVEPIYLEVDALASSNTVLTATRDLLLPRLISGMLSVENLDIQFPPSMIKPKQVES
jgi:type I restriction enzyme S subunit